MTVSAYPLTVPADAGPVDQPVGRPAPERDPGRRACMGADTMSVRMGCEHAQECLHCGRKVRDDMTDHPFFGFAASGCKQ